MSAQQIPIRPPRIKFNCWPAKNHTLHAATSAPKTQFEKCVHMLDMLIFATALCATLEGKTAKQKNPHQKCSLAWLAWIVARLGGWSGYQRYGPAGPKTMAAGWDKCIIMQQGWDLRKNFCSAWKARLCRHARERDPVDGGRLHRA
jgi:hypothetical protein